MWLHIQCQNWRKPTKFEEKLYSLIWFWVEKCRQEIKITSENFPVAKIHFMEYLIIVSWFKTNKQWLHKKINMQFWRVLRNNLASTVVRQHSWVPPLYQNCVLVSIRMQKKIYCNIICAIFFFFSSFFSSIWMFDKSVLSSNQALY